MVVFKNQFSRLCLTLSFNFYSKLTAFLSCIDSIHGCIQNHEHSLPFSPHHIIVFFFSTTIIIIIPILFIIFILIFHPSPPTCLCESIRSSNSSEFKSCSDFLRNFSLTQACEHTSVKQYLAYSLKLEFSFILWLFVVECEMKYV